MITISSCGTSIITNRSRNTAISEILTRNANLKENKISKENYNIIERHIRTVKEEFSRYDINQARAGSAELNGLLGIYNGNLNEAINDSHYLIYTDTYLGEESAKIVEEWMRNKGINYVIPLKIPLTAADQRQAREGLIYLIKKIKEIRDETENQKIVFNLVGGFKLLQGFMQTIGMFYADEIFYLFEKSSNMIKIPKLSIKFDYSDEILENLRRLKYELTPNNTFNLDILKDPDYNILSEWGELVWEESKKEFYKKLRNPLTDKIRYTERFKKDFSDLTDKNKVELHENIDSLALYLKTQDNRYNLRQLRYHPLQGTPNEMTNEFYCFSGRDDRVFGVEADGVFTLHYIGPHL